VADPAQFVPARQCGAAMNGGPEEAGKAAAVRPGGSHGDVILRLVELEAGG